MFADEAVRVARPPSLHVPAHSPFVFRHGFVADVALWFVSRWSGGGVASDDVVTRFGHVEGLPLTFLRVPSWLWFGWGWLGVRGWRGWHVGVCPLWGWRGFGRGRGRYIGVCLWWWLRFWRWCLLHVAVHGVHLPIPCSGTCFAVLLIVGFGVCVVIV